VANSISVAENMMIYTKNWNYSISFIKFPSNVIINNFLQKSISFFDVIMLVSFKVLFNFEL
jgi:hypothetical protein